MEVLSPGSKNLQTYMMNRLLVHMCREFQAAEKRRLPPYIRVDELLSPFPYLSEASFRKRIKEYAHLQVMMAQSASYPNFVQAINLIELFLYPSYWNLF